VSVDDSGRTGGGDAWDPGLESEIPRRLQSLVTLYRPENAFLGHGEVEELAELCGLEMTELAALRPERLVAHELLVRVSADLTVPDGPNYADLGISLRSMVATLSEHHVAPRMESIREAFEAERSQAVTFIDERLSERLFGGEGVAPPGKVVEQRSFLARLFGGGVKRTRHSPPVSPEAREMAALQAWRRERDETEPGLRRACLDALVRTVGGIVGRRGRLIADRELIRRIAVNLVCNDRGATLVGELLEPIVAEGIVREGYRRLPPQKEPVVMNVKGASASGKSTIRPQQRQLAEKLGVPWEDFALISPDYWRKYLLDYDTLGEDHRYAAMLCGRELEIVDRKLDRHMAAKAARGEMSHLLLDRFRFDSFALEEKRPADSRLLTRFGHRIYLFFMVTPPTETVERAWVRGTRTGRYKAVSDLLFHNVEAFTGMPALFLSWVNADDKEIHFEFLDNDVPEGRLPRTAAFGWNDSMTILDVDLLLDVDRYRKVNVEALRPEEVLAADLEPERNLDFVRRCTARIARVDFADPDSGRVYARVEGGKLAWWDRDHVERAETSAGVRAALVSLGYTGEAGGTEPAGGVPNLDAARERHFTVGDWGEPRSVSK